jgi:hypothetical protein
MAVVAPVVRPECADIWPAVVEAGQLQQIKTLEVGGVDPDPRSHEVADEHGLRAHLADGFVERNQQTVTGRARGAVFGISLTARERLEGKTRTARN